MPKVTKLDARKEYHCLSSLSQLVSDAVVVSMMNGTKIYNLRKSFFVNSHILLLWRISCTPMLFIHLHYHKFFVSTPTFKVIKMHLYL